MTGALKVYVITYYCSSATAIAFPRPSASRSYCCSASLIEKKIEKINCFETTNEIEVINFFVVCELTLFRGLHWVQSLRQRDVCTVGVLKYFLCTAVIVVLLRIGPCKLLLVVLTRCISLMVLWYSRLSSRLCLANYTVGIRVVLLMHLLLICLSEARWLELLRLCRQLLNLLLRLRRNCGHLLQVISIQMAVVRRR